MTKNILILKSPAWFGLRPTYSALSLGYNIMVSFAKVNLDTSQSLGSSSTKASMNSTSLSTATPEFNDRKWLNILLLILGLRAIFSLSIGFADDDAYHWTWTQQMEWSYFDHPGMIAWLEKLTTLIFGDNRLGIRLPSFICFSTTVFIIWKLTANLFDKWAATFTAGLLLFSPLWGFGGYVSAPEQPFMLLWLIAVYVFWNGVREDDLRWSTKKTWLYLGVIMGLGFNSKFIMVLLAPGFGFYLLTSPKRRKDLLSVWPWVGILIATLALFPVVIWNLKYDWPSFKFQFHDRHTGGGFDPARWLKYLSMQLVLISPGIYASILFAFAVGVRKLRESPKWRLLVCLSLPSFMVFYPQPLWADFKPHWMGPAYLILLMGVGGIWSQGISWGSKQLVKARSKKFFWLNVAFLIPMNFLIYAPLFYPWVPKVARAVAPNAPWELKNDVSNEFFGWPEVGQRALEIQAQIEKETGKKPFFAGHRYEMTAQTWKAVMQRTYMLTLTRSHYTVETTDQELAALIGQDALMIASDKYDFDPMEFAKFDSCSPTEFKFYRADELARVFKIFHCKNFQKILR